jgi:BMFP domain-containing protein YqiC
MEKQNFVHDFQQKLIEMFRASPAADLERNIKALMAQTFSKLELVNRDEFEIQVELLRALRTRVEALEEKLQQTQQWDPPGSGSVSS